MIVWVDLMIVKCAELLELPHMVCCSLMDRCFLLPEVSVFSQLFVVADELDDVSLGLHPIENVLLNEPLVIDILIMLLFFFPLPLFEERLMIQDVLTWGLVHVFMERAPFHLG